ncbi:chemotaxis protein CheW [Alkalilimnicola sp. S0819]|uniref:chemotaxis protein CheW n=1 Tax=Alkalilimnicola sp. S0819 TaxID=2613922 RepID=UPI0012615D26|nr:chemotaxis protein CheW [Alkalilimnicola sp. S0819]KAB7627158.1 chemotaxis protein CheW [Alkalilimnicola sp. S0819]MPQ15867.1 chemotaxis protein CheW [Alkalilimnicola sp. S0819]
MAEEQQQDQGRVTQWVTFNLDNETYGINVMQVQEVLPMAEIAPVPGAPPFVMGILNLRGNVVTVIDTRMRFGLSHQDAEASSRVVVIEANDQIAGILVDSVTEVVEVSETEVDTAPNVGNEESARYIYGVVSRQEGLLILVDVNKLLTKEEWAEVAQM